MPLRSSQPNSRPQKFHTQPTTNLTPEINPKQSFELALKKFKCVTNAAISRWKGFALLRIQLTPFYQCERNHKMKGMLRILSRIFLRNKLKALTHLREIFLKETQSNTNRNYKLQSKAQSASLNQLSRKLQKREYMYLKKFFTNLKLYSATISNETCRRNRQFKNAIIGLFERKIRSIFNTIENTTYAKSRNSKCRKLTAIVQEMRRKQLSFGLLKLSVNLFLKRKEGVLEKPKEKEGSFKFKTAGDDFESDKLALLEKQENLAKLLEKAKEEYQMVLDSQGSQHQPIRERNKAVNRELSEIKINHAQILEEIEIKHKEIHSPFSLDEIYHFFFTNFIYQFNRITQNNATVGRTFLLQSFEKPLFPLHISLQQIQEENQLMEKLIQEYVILFGQKKIENGKQNLSYEFLLKENFQMYQILRSLLPHVEYDPKDFKDLQQSILSAEAVLNTGKK